MKSSSLLSFIHYVLYYAPCIRTAGNATYSLNMKITTNPSIISAPLLPDIGEQVLARGAKPSCRLWRVVGSLRDRCRGRCAAPAAELLVRADFWCSARLGKPIATRNNALARQRRSRAPSEIVCRCLRWSWLGRAPSVVRAHSVEVAPPA